MADTMPAVDVPEGESVGDVVDFPQRRTQPVNDGNTAPVLEPDPVGDAPWTRTRAARKGDKRRRARRMARRWWARQSTAQGHAAQLRRGHQRTWAWVRGVEGVHVQAAHHHAHTAARDARQAARAARFTVMPKQREHARRIAQQHHEAAIKAVAEHRKARTDARTRRAMRAGLVYGTPLVADLVSWAELGWGGLIAAVVTTGGTLAVIGRKPLAEEQWDPERRSLADGDPLSETMLDRAFTAAKIITEGQLLRMFSPVMADPHRPQAWQAFIDLPDGVTIKKVKERELELAAALGVDRSHLDIEQAGGAARVSLWVSATDPLLATRKSPLLNRRKALNTWRDGIPIAFDKRGRIIYVTVSDYSLLFGGATRSGKGMGLANLLAGALLDPRVRIRLFDGKGTGEYVPLAPVLATFVRRNPRRLRDFLRLVVEEMNRRTEILVELGLSKLTEELIEKVGGMELVIVDELATYTAAKGPSAEYAEEITELLAQIGAAGAAVGIVLALATQYPEVEIVPSRLRGNLAGKMAMRVDTPAASNTILGDGMVGQGYDSSKIANLKSTRGRAWLSTPDTGVIEARSLFIDESRGEIHQVTAVGTELRRAAGTLPGMCADPIEAALLRVTGASSAAGGVSGNGGIQAATILDHLVAAARGTGRGAVSNTEAFLALAKVDPGRYAPADGEAEQAYGSRAGKALKAQLAELGVDLEPVRITLPDGSRPNGYTLPALEKAAADARNARK